MLDSDISKLAERIIICKQITLTCTGEQHVIFNDADCSVGDVIIASGRNGGANLNHTIAYDGQIGFVFNYVMTSGLTVRINYVIIK